MSIPDEWVSIIWEKGRIDPRRDINPDTFRLDDYGELMERGQYGKRESVLGWEADHIIPESKGGRTELSNLRPLNWQSNLERNNSEK